MHPEKYFFNDDGHIPNSFLPVLVYRNILSVVKPDAGTFKKLFNQHNWSNDWDNGVYDYHHYHSITHEVLGVYKGKAILLMGGEEGRKIEVQAGDVIIIPAGVGHKNLQSEDLGVIGAYPDGMDYDIKKGEQGERPEADHQIAAVPLPQYDPVYGKNKGLVENWN